MFGVLTLEFAPTSGGCWRLVAVSGSTRELHPLVVAALIRRGFTETTSQDATGILSHAQALLCMN